MTQLQYYASLMTQVVAILALIGGFFSLSTFAVLAYYLYPWVKK